MGSAHDGRRGGSSLSGPLDGFPPTTEEDGLRGRGGGAGAMASASGRHGGSSRAIPPAAPAGGTKGNAKGNRRSFHRRRLALKVAVVVLTVISAFAVYLSLTGRSGVVEEKVDRLKQSVGRKMDKVKSRMDRVKKTTVERPRRAAKALMERVHDTADRYHLHLPASDQGERGELLETNVRSIDEGLQSWPFVMIKSKLDDNLLSRFLDEHLYSCEEDTLSHVPDLDSRVSPPVYVYEGHYHALATGGTVYSKNPDPTKGNDFDKPAASRFTRAFYMAFREVNREIFDGLREELVKASSHGTTGTDDACHVLAQWIERGNHFADLSVQIHYGEGNRPKLVSGAAWHADAENSLLHLALTLRGERKLHTRRNRLASVRGGKLSPAEVVEGQSPGDLYLTSSTLVRHAPEFRTTTYEERVVAIHARILYTNDEVWRFRESRTPEGWRKMTEVLSKTLARAKLVVPSLHQVDRQLARLL